MVYCRWRTRSNVVMGATPTDLEKKLNKFLDNLQRTNDVRNISVAPMNSPGTCGALVKYEIAEYSVEWV